MENKQQKIIQMFDAIAPSYDLANRVISLGIDVKWRKEACVKALELLPNKELVIADVACGTGDMIIHWEEAIAAENKAHAKPTTKESENPRAQVKRQARFVGIDPSSGMLEVAKEKLAPLLDSQNAKLIQAQAQDLSALESSSIDIVSIAYGLRNVMEVDRALEEFHRVLKERGILVILEFTKKSKEGILDKLAGFYTKIILPLLGGLISKNYAAYAYLPDSIDVFLSAEILTSKLRQRGFCVNVSKGYSANISTLIIATKEING